MMLSEYPWEFAVRVYVEDTDKYGIVYHSNYANFMERSRTEWLRSKGYNLSKMTKAGNLILIHKLIMDFHAPARCDDLLTVTFGVVDKRKTSFTAEQLIFNQRQEKICRGKIRMVCVNEQHKPNRIPFDIEELCYGSE